MVFNTGAALLDAVVLAVVSNEPDGAYGYRITQDVRQVLEVSESTLYPVLRRLLKDGCLEIYDKEVDGRNRRYYELTEPGKERLGFYREAWGDYSGKVTRILREAER
ncbi:MAG: helix-turn-helix transcriptional regulator [Lachnospiraceae bacterium]|nr:helix-turn-helix transcriptional regulator [Lachnospiraceae bacterium]